MSLPTNAEIAAALDELGDLYELDGAIIHRVVAYRNGAKAVRDQPRSVAQLAIDGTAVKLPGIGATLQEKIADLATTGEIPAAVKLRTKFPAGLVAVTRLPGLGPKRARLLHEQLGVDSLDALRAAAESQQIRTLKGFGLKVEESVLASLDAGLGQRPAARVVLDRALAIAEPLVAALRAHPASDRVEVAGSARRWAESVKDLDIIASASDPAALVKAAGELDEIQTVQAAGESGTKLVTHTGMSIDLRIIAPEQFGNLLQHFSGSREHNMALREAAVRRGLHISEYGILDDADQTTTTCETEEEVYARLGYAYIEPELRENRGELEAAWLDGGAGLPQLVTLDDLRGDLHAHTVASDGTATIEELAAAAKARGLKYLAITDHSATHGFGDHVTPDALWKQIDRVHAANAKTKGIELLAGSEVNILPDGSLDYDDELLAALDWVIASVHTAFRMDAQSMTKRVIAAIEHSSVDAIGHLTGRKIERRDPYGIDVEAVIEAAAGNGTMIEINASPNRRDLNDVHARAAAQAGVPILINTDAHSVGNFALARYGVATARRAWLTKDQIANTRTWKQFAPLRKRAGGKGWT